jgi:Mlc titration factor MtfA (ptsG expression regulator)
MALLDRWWRRLRPAPPTPVAESAWAYALAGLPVCAGLDAAESDRLRALATGFLADKLFETAGGAVLDESVRLRIAALAALPVLGLGLDWYADWRTVIVYPGEFVRPRSELDPIGVMHEWEDVLGGESWERGPVVLSLADVAASGLLDGYNVVIHEMAHKLDMRNGLPDGFPPLPGDIDRRRWTEAFTAAFEDLNARLDRGEDTAIDPYAAEEPGEFFAVLSEYFFEQPDLVRSEYPDVYDLLAGFYRQDPAARLRRAGHAAFSSHAPDS